MLSGKTVLLRPIEAGELELVYRLITNVNSKGLFWHLDFPSHQSFQKEYETNGCWGPDEGRVLIVKKDAPFPSPEAMIGELIYFKGLDYQDGLEIGYEIFDTANFGKGYMTEALQLFCSFLFAARPFHRVQVNLMKGNIGSRKVAEKCGFIYEGTMRGATYLRGKYHDLELFSLLRDECLPLETILCTE